MNKNQNEAHVVLMATEGVEAAHAALVSFQIGGVAEEKSDFVEAVVTACQSDEVGEIILESHKAIAQTLSTNYVLRVTQ
jgi:hypothetical protein